MTTNTIYIHLQAFPACGASILSECSLMPRLYCTCEKTGCGVLSHVACGWGHSLRAQTREITEHYIYVHDVDNLNWM